MRKKEIILSALLLLLLALSGCQKHTRIELRPLKERQGTEASVPDAALNPDVQEYILNMKSHKFHLSSCSGAASMSEANRWDYTGTREEVMEMGYEPCGICEP